MLKLLWTLALVISAAGCATDNRRLVKDGISPDEMRADFYACERDTRMSAASFGNGVTAPTYARNFAIRCMMARGYRFELADAGRGKTW